MLTSKQLRGMFFDYWWIPALLIILGLLSWWAYDSYSTYRENKGVRVQKEKIANTVAEIANISNQVSNLQQKRAEKQGELKVETEILANNVFGYEEAKAETNAALANYQQAVNANRNVDVTGKQLEEAAARLANTQ